MRAYEIRGSFGLENLTLIERDGPREPGPGEVLVRVQAVSLNYRDLMTVWGNYNPRQPLPLIPCSDAAGVVEKVGPGLERIREGQTVCTTFFQNWIAGSPLAERTRSALGGPLDGVLAEFVTLPEDGVIPAPAHLSPVEASTLPCAALTSWTALMVQDSIKPGSTVLILGTGGVSMFAAQFARNAGARVIITSSSDQKIARLHEMGYTETINYQRTPEWAEEVRAKTNRQGVDHVVEVGGAGTLGQSIRAVRPGGTISLIGVLSGTTSDLNIAPVLMKSIRIQGVFVGHRDSFAEMNRALELNNLHPYIHETFRFVEAPAAFRLMEQGTHMGKICIALD